MKGFIVLALLAMPLLPAQANAKENLLARNWSKVDENHAELERGGKTYVLDSYIVLFEQPYYIHVRTKDGQALDAADAEAMAAEYIQPRGCTQPLERRKDLDRSNGDGSELVLGFQC
ncbi:hypothetical protein ABB26_11140 [Stenotrophomonas humi]|uniref:Uncharacterized protein n=1 Tax=Stenotrophomonas humi TaxID=405444 RepID=A0A0R0C1R4_9GAMM|nr:hypothetical protein [Stenotrophomonas humi]KRG63753.1 hypothetical protein ABB26_11140 [Stenotrophomonas humi]